MIYIPFNDKEMGCSMDITDEIFRTFYEEEKLIDSDIVWKRVGKAYTTDHIQILNNAIDYYDVTLICRLNKYNDFAFNIVYHRTNKPLVRFDTEIHPPNLKDNHTKQKLDEPHKHKFKKGCKKDLTAKIIPETEVDRRDVNKAFYQFLNECNIRLEGSYYAIIIPVNGVIQTELTKYIPPIFDHVKKGGEK